MHSIDLIKNYFLELQNQISNYITTTDPHIQAITDNWQRPQGGGGVSCAFSQGEFYEKVAVNFSHVWGDQLPTAASNIRANLNLQSFEATGISVIFHPTNPFAPTCHANLRYFSAKNAENKLIWWFGGGFDLTPYYGFEEDCIHWHKTAKKACDPFGDAIYPRYKKWADDYFYIKHREEPRGIGGIFFDDLNEWDFETCFSFVRSVGDHFLPAYAPIVSRRCVMPYTETERQFQLYRRGRYVEFNLVYDRGTLFGLQSGGRVESILLSLPPLVAWHYNLQPAPGSKEAELQDKFLKPQDWA